ncbi:MAG: baseplate J/gp47 family protein [Chloroflexi bacterium]|nr:baseplate J/gp47 family protein [Chloroflexota bacterium]
MTFAAKKFSEIFNTMRQRAEADGVITDFEVGSVARTLVESFSYEIGTLYEQMRLVYLSAFVDTAEGQQLDMVVATLGITRSEPDFALGVVTFQRDVGNEAIEIPFGTLVTTEDIPDAPKKVYQTVEAKPLVKDQTSIDVRVQAVNRGTEEVVDAGAIVVMPRPILGIKSVANAEATTFTGKRRETDDELRSRAKNALISSGKASVIAIENALLSLPGVRDARVIEKFDEEPPQYGVIEVYVDGIDFDDQADVKRVRDTLDGVRAAGIFALLLPAVALQIASVFKIELSPSLKLNPEQRSAFEENVRDQIESYLESLKMGDPLLLSQVTKAILSVSGVNDLAQFTMAINRREANGTLTPINFDPTTDRRVNSQPSERFKAMTICVASEDKALPINLAFQASAGLTEAAYDGLLTALGGYFGGLALGDPVETSAITSAITSAGITLAPGTLVLTPKPWCGSVDASGTTVSVRFVEKADLGTVFAYHSTLNVVGALRVTLPTFMADAEKQEAIAAVEANLQDYLENLAPEADIVFQDLVDHASSVASVQRVDLDPDDFSVRLNNGAPLVGRVDDDAIEINAFEKPAFEHFCVAAATQVINVTITGVAVTVTVAGATPTGQTLANKREEIRTGIAGKALLPDLDTGEDVSYDAVRSAIEALIPGVSLTVTAFIMSGISACDGRSQTLSSTGTSLHVRSIEVASITQIGTSEITVTVVGTS